MSYVLSKIDDYILSDFSNDLGEAAITFSVSSAKLTSSSRKLIANTLLLTTFSFTGSSTVTSNIKITVPTWSYENSYTTIKNTIFIKVNALRADTCEPVFNSNNYSESDTELTFSINSLQTDATYRGVIIQVISSLPSSYKCLSKIDDYIIAGSPLAIKNRTFTDGSITNVYNISAKNLQQIYLDENLLLTSFDFTTKTFTGAANCTITPSSSLTIENINYLTSCIDYPGSGYTVNSGASWYINMTGFVSGDTSTHTCYLLYYIV